MFSLRIRGIEESNSSSSSFKESTSRRRWCRSFLENKGKSSESTPTIYSLVWRSMESMGSSRRKSKKEIPILYWWFRNTCLFPSSSRTFRTQSCWPFITGQCCHSQQFLPIFFKHIGCAFNLHSIINSGSIPGCQNSSKRQTVFFLPVDSMDKRHKDPDDVDLNVPRHAQYLHNAWKWTRPRKLGRHQFVFKKGLQFYQTRSNAIILQETLPAYCFPKVVRMKIGEVLHDLHPWFHWNTNGKETWGFGSCSTTRRRSCSTSTEFPTNPTNSKSNSWEIGATW